MVFQPFFQLFMQYSGYISSSGPLMSSKSNACFLIDQRELFYGLVALTYNICETAGAILRRNLQPALCMALPSRLTRIFYLADTTLSTLCVHVAIPENRFHARQSI